jgi:Uma2 family endonuclease
MEICPDFVAELRSSTDRLPDIRAKMQEYIACGARLGWLMDPVQRKVWIYRPGLEVEQLEEPLTVAGGGVLPGFVLGLNLILESSDLNPRRSMSSTLLTAMPAAQ